MKKEKVLFICVHNSARSQMAEELLRKRAGDMFEVESAGLEPGVLNPHVVKILKEDEGIDISGKKTKSAFELYKLGRRYNYVITVCDESSSEKCPVFPGGAKHLHWGFPDPSGIIGSDEQVISRIRGIKEDIKARIEQFVTSNDPVEP